MTPLSVLYVDDDPDIRTIVSMALSLDPGISLRTAGSAADALAMLADGEAPDVALLDVMMPGTDGPTLLDRLRAQEATRGVPVIFLTASGREADIARYRERGAIGVILKPFDPLTLAADLRRLARGDGE